MAAVGLPLRPGDPPRVGAYELRRVLGTGGMGTVFLATGADGQPVAVKVINEAARDDPLFRDRFAREVSAASRVASFCTAKVLDADPSGPVPFLVTEYVAGPSLYEYVQGRGPLRGNVEALAVGVAAALTAIHAVGLVHGDLTPRNVLLSPFGPKVVDFGVARFLGRTGPIGGVAFGTPGWLAPEQLAGLPASQASDVFCWGLMVAWACTGVPPFGGPTPDGTIPAPHASPNLNDLARVSPRLASLVRHALHPDAGRRPPARDLLLSLVGRVDSPSVRAAVAPLTRALPAPATRRQPPSAWPGTGGWGATPAVRPRRRRRGRRVLAWVGVAVLAVCVLGALNNSADPPDTDAGANPAGTVQKRSTTPPSRTAADGKLRFTVTDLRCGPARLGTQPLVKRAQGQFCLLTLRVENIGKGGGRVWPGSQRLFDAQDREYRADDWSAIYYEGSRPFVDEINPGNSVTGTLVYDVPAGVKFRKLVVRDSLFSLGTAIQLG